MSWAKTAQGVEVEKHWQVEFIVLLLAGAVLLLAGARGSRAAIRNLHALAWPLLACLLGKDGKC